MVKSRNVLKYEEDMTDQEKAELLQGGRKFSRTHVGRKIVEAYLVPSAIVDNAETNRAKILKYVYSRDFRVSGVKNRGHARVEFESY